MNKKVFTLLTILMCFVFGMSGNAEEKIINANGGEVNILGQMTKVPEYTKWFYFSFETGEVVGESPFTLEDLEGGKTEVPNAEWAARNDWDIAFHATDIRTNGLKAVLVADTTSEKPLDEVYAELTEAPAEGFEADEILNGTFIASMSEGMPPPLTRQMSVCKATHGWATYGMTGGATKVNTMVVVFQLAEDKFVKVYLKEFLNEEGLPGYIKMDYALLNEDGSSNENVGGTKVSAYPNPATDVIHVVLPDSEENTSVGVYSLSGTLVKQVNAKAGINTIAVSDLSAGMYIVRTKSTAHKILVK